MDTCKFLTATALVAALSIPTITHAALVGRLAATEGGTDYQAYYDTEADLTWLADAGASGGNLNWSETISWAAELNVAGISDWRLPNAPMPDLSCDLQSGAYSFGYNCTGSEMGNLFYNVLGGVAGRALISAHNSNYELFSNITNTRYWSSQTYEIPFQHNAVYLDMANGNTYYSGQIGAHEAWAVHDGDIGAAVSTVPVPASIWLLGSGLIVLIGLSKRKFVINDV